MTYLLIKKEIWNSHRHELVYAENVLKDSDDKLYNNSYSYNY